VSSLAVFFLLNPLWPIAVDDSHHTPALGSLGNDYLDGIGSSAKDRADLGTGLDGIEYINWKSVLEKDKEQMSSRDLFQISHGSLLQGLIIALEPNQAVTRGLGKGQAEFSLGAAAAHNFVQILNGFDKVRLAENTVAPLRD